MDWVAIIGRNVRKRRQELGLTQEQLAHDAELTMRYLGAVERGQQNPSIRILARICAALHCDIPDLFTR